MKKYFIIRITVCTIFMVYGCLQTNACILTCRGHASETSIRHNNEDSLAIIKAFRKMEKDPVFLKELGLADESHPESLFNEDIFRLFIGDVDVDGDGKGDGRAPDDALLLFAVEGRAGGNNWMAYYAYFKKSGNNWLYKANLRAGAWSEPLYYEVERIKKGEIKGYLRSGTATDWADIAQTYIVKDGQFLNTYTELHSKEGPEHAPDPFLLIENILLSDNRLLPLSGSQKEYESILGKGMIEVPTQPSACGTYFEEDTIRYIVYPNFRFEQNSQGKMALVYIDLSGSGIKVQTNKGTITEKTGHHVLLKSFENGEKYEKTNEAEPDNKVLMIPTGQHSDSRWEINYKQPDQITSIALFIPC